MKSETADRDPHLWEFDDREMMDDLNLLEKIIRFCWKCISAPPITDILIIGAVAVACYFSFK